MIFGRFRASNQGVNSGDRYREVKSKQGSFAVRFAAAFGVFVLLAPSAIAATVNTHSLPSTKPKSPNVNETQHARKHMRRLARSRVPGSRVSTTHATRRRRHRYYERFTASSF